MKKALIILFVIQGCYPGGEEPPCSVRMQEEILIEAYETWRLDFSEEKYPPVDDRFRNCMARYKVRFVPDVYEYCPSPATGCYVVFGIKRREPIIFIEESVLVNPSFRTDVINHELIHHLMNCRGNPNGDHDEEVWYPVLEAESLQFIAGVEALDTVSPLDPFTCEPAEYY